MSVYGTASNEMINEPRIFSSVQSSDKLVKSWVVFFQANWFLLGLFAVIGFAKLNPEIGATGGVLHPESSTSIGVCIIFFCSGISIPTAELVKGVFNIRLHFSIQFFSFIIIPVLIAILSHILYYLIPDLIPQPGDASLSPEMLQTPMKMASAILLGVRIVAALPPPVSTALIITQVIEGNVSGAIFNSALGSFLGVIVTPTVLLLSVGVASDVTFSSIFLKLGSTVLLPLIVGQLARFYAYGGVQAARVPESGSYKALLRDMPFSGISKAVLLVRTVITLITVKDPSEMWCCASRFCCC
jgi:sodium/bile acid cotransporter 7